MAIDYGIPSGLFVRLGAPLPHPQPEDTGWTHAHVSSSITATAQSTGSTAAAALELDSPLKRGGIYMFEYNLIYSISGLSVGAQFGVGLASGGLVSIGYSVMLAADGSSMRSAATTTPGALIGSGSSFSGGGPWSCCITGALVVDDTVDPVARLSFKGSGISVSVTLQPNSTAYYQEV